LQPLAPRLQMVCTTTNETQQDTCTSHDDCLGTAACLQPTRWAPRACTSCQSCVGVAETGTPVANTHTLDSCPSYCSATSACYGLGPACSAATAPEYCSSRRQCTPSVASGSSNRYCADDTEWLVSMSREHEHLDSVLKEDGKETPVLPQDTKGICRTCPVSCTSYQDVWTTEMSEFVDTNAADVQQGSNNGVCPMSCNPDGPCYMMPDSKCHCSQCVRARVLPVVVLFLFVFLCVLTLCLAVLVRRGRKHQTGYRKAHKAFITMTLSLVTFSGFAIAEKSKEWWQYDLTMVTVFTSLVSLIMVFAIPVLSLDSCTPCAESDFRATRDTNGRSLPRTREHRLCLLASWVLWVLALIIATVVLAQVSAHETLPRPGVLLTAGFFGSLSLLLMAMCVHLSNVRAAVYAKHHGIALKTHPSPTRSGSYDTARHRSPRVTDSHEPDTGEY
jgi:hypothetical protein